MPALPYDIGDIITYRCFGDELRTVRVTSKVPDMKRGRPGFDGVMLTGRGEVVWGYDSQIESVRRSPMTSKPSGR